MDQFLNPKSMMTPGFAGGLTMLVANSLCFVFPEMAFRYVALALSFLIGFAAVAAVEGQLGMRVVYWVVNSLIIFSMGVGSSNIGANLTEPVQATHAAATTEQSAWAFFIEEASAQDRGSATNDAQRQRFFRRW